MWQLGWGDVLRASSSVRGGGARCDAPGRSSPDHHLLTSNHQARTPTEQLTHLNHCLQAQNLAPLALVDALRPVSARNVRVAGRLAPVSDGPLVSVLMTTFNSADWVHAAVASVLGQTWQRLELIVVDDASTDGTAERVAALAAADARVRLIRLPRNAGTYAAKHVGLQHAQGEFVTCHDSDDWSHPQKIERQMAPLLARRSVVASTSCWVRVSDEGVFHARQVYPLMRWNPSSPLFRREVVLAHAGAWDVVRTGADSEFLDRLRAVFGPKAIHRVSELLALGSHRPGSLMTDAATGYDAAGTSPSREAYVQAWKGWHAQALAARSRPMLPVCPLAVLRQRPFAAPAEIAVDAEALAHNVAQAGVPGFAERVAAAQRWATTSGALAGLPTLPALLGGAVQRVPPWSLGRGLAGVLAWGRKPSADRAQAWAARRRLPVLRLEDGFLRSFGTGDRFPPLSIVVDEVGIYYDSTRPSALENLLQSEVDVLAGHEATVAQARALMQRHGLSKYNHAPPLAQVEAQQAAQGLPPLLRPQDHQRVLVVDQTAGDLSIALGGASAQTFADMLAAALAEHPQATVYVKTHPEVSAGRKGGHFGALGNSDRVVVLRQAIEPASLLREMDHVYVVSSTLGFEALLAGKPVTCFGLPWYAGWGATQDRQRCPRRTRTRSVDELFAAAYLHHARYLNPDTLQRGTILDVIHWLARQRQRAGLLASAPAWHGERMLAVGLRRWKQAQLQPLLSLQAGRVAFAPTADAAAALHPTAADALVSWGTPKPGMAELAQRSGARLVRVEDGFVRSVGLGSDLIRPRSLVLDAEGIYFDPSQPSALERLLATAPFGADELAEAARVRAFIVAHGITKYNHEPREPARWATQGRRVVLVPGQVEDDASIRLGCTTVKTNAALLQAARAACPDAFIVYKPHPDVSSGNRAGALALAQARQWADHVEPRLSVVSCLEACDELHTMTSLAGFDALLRGKHVVTHGQPFYAGWGLTDDRAVGGAALARRHRQLSLDELVAGTLLRYPIYWDWTLRGHTTCMAVLRQLQAERDALVASGGLDALRSGWARRQARKARILLHAWLKG